MATKNLTYSILSRTDSKKLAELLGGLPPETQQQLVRTDYNVLRLFEAPTTELILAALDGAGSEKNVRQILRETVNFHNEAIAEWVVRERPRAADGLADGLPAVSEEALMRLCRQSGLLTGQCATRLELMTQCRLHPERDVEELIAEWIGDANCQYQFRQVPLELRTPTLVEKLLPHAPKLLKTLPEAERTYERCLSAVSVNGELIEEVPLGHRDTALRLAALRSRVFSSELLRPSAPVLPGGEPQSWSPELLAGYCVWCPESMAHYPAELITAEVVALCDAEVISHGWHETQLCRVNYFTLTAGFFTEERVERLLASHPQLYFHLPTVFRTSERLTAAIPANVRYASSQIGCNGFWRLKKAGPLAEHEEDATPWREWIDTLSQGNPAAAGAQCCQRAKEDLASRRKWDELAQQASLVVEEAAALGVLREAVAFSEKQEGLSLYLRAGKIKEVLDRLDARLVTVALIEVLAQANLLALKYLPKNLPGVAAAELDRLCERFPLVVWQAPLPARPKKPKAVKVDAPPLPSAKGLSKLNEDQLCERLRKEPQLFAVLPKARRTLRVASVVLSADPALLAEVVRGTQELQRDSA